LLDFIPEGYRRLPKSIWLALFHLHSTNLEYSTPVMRWNCL
jgi:hypothetical protein